MINKVLFTLLLVSALIVGAILYQNALDNQKVMYDLGYTDGNLKGYDLGYERGTEVAGRPVVPDFPDSSCKFNNDDGSWGFAGNGSADVPVIGITATIVVKEQVSLIWIPDLERFGQYRIPMISLLHDENYPVATAIAVCGNGEIWYLLIPYDPAMQDPNYELDQT